MGVLKITVLCRPGELVSHEMDHPVVIRLDNSDEFDGSSMLYNYKRNVFRSCDLDIGHSDRISFTSPMLARKVNLPVLVTCPHCYPARVCAGRVKRLLLSVCQSVRLSVCPSIILKYLSKWSLRSV